MTDQELQSPAEAEIERLRAVLTACQEDAARMRIWGGMDWKWHSHYAQTIHERCERALEMDTKTRPSPKRQGERRSTVTPQPP